MNETSNEVAVQPAKRISLVERMAERFSVDPTKLMSTLKATAFKVKGDGTKDSGGATDEQMMALLIVADQYKLNPFTREIYAFPDKGGIVPVVGVDGWSRIINQDPNFDGMEFKMATDGSECTCTIYRKDRAHPTSITEYFVECKRDTPSWKSHPRRSLRHKSLIQCGRVAFGFVGIYDQDEAERIIQGEVVGREPAGKPRVEQPKSKSAKAAETAQSPTDTLTESEGEAARRNAAEWLDGNVPQ